jgi:tellurite resistance protein
MQRKLTIIVMALMASTAAFSQTSSTETPRLDARQAKQEARIGQGVSSGGLTTNEAARLDAAQDRLQAAEDKAKADGVLTARERARLEHSADVQSRRIARQKGDRQVDRNLDGKKDRPTRAR